MKERLKYVFLYMAIVTLCGILYYGLTAVCGTTSYVSYVWTCGIPIVCFIISLYILYKIRAD